MRHKLRLWMFPLIGGLLLTAHPAGRWAKRTLFHWRSVSQWEQRNLNETGPEAAWLTIPSVRIDRLVLAGASKHQLNLAPCLEPIADNTLILAHRDTHFQGLEKSKPGDAIQLEQRDGTQKHFHISDTLIVEADQLETILQNLNTTNQLLLVTCYPFRHIGPAPKRIILFASPAPISTHENHTS